MSTCCLTEINKSNPQKIFKKWNLRSPGECQVVLSPLTSVFLLLVRISLSLSLPFHFFFHFKNTNFFYFIFVQERDEKLEINMRNNNKMGKTRLLFVFFLS